MPLRTAYLFRTLNRLSVTCRSLIDLGSNYAITEVLAASSAAQQEAYSQSPAVIAKKWKHSGGKKNNTRENHTALDGTIVGVDEYLRSRGAVKLVCIQGIQSCQQKKE
ncbi:phage minor head protein [Bacillus paralicheniformis]